MDSGVKFLFNYAWQNNRIYVFVLFANQLVKSAIPIITIIFPKLIFDAISADEILFERLLVYAGVYLTLLFILTSLDRYFWRKAFKEKNKLFKQFQVDLAKNLIESDLDQLENSSFLDKREKAHKFIYADGQGFGFVLDRTFNIISKVIIFIGVILIISRLSIVIAAIFAVITLINNRIILSSKKAFVEHELEKAVIERKATHFSNLSADFKYAKEIRLNSIGEWILNKMCHYLNESRKFYSKQMNILLKAEVRQYLGDYIKNILAYGYLIYSIVAGNITIGDFAMYLAAIASFSSAMDQLMDSVTDIKKFGGYYAAVKEYLNLPKTLRDEIVTTEDEIGAFEKIEFKNVSFKYSGQERYALRNVNMTIEKGVKYALVGENGAGKSTLAKLLCRLYNPTEGEILYNGVNIKNIEYEEYMDVFSTVFQDFKLFSTSLRENICFDAEVDDEDIVQVIRDVGLSSLYDKLPFGIDTNIYKDFDPNGFEPSGGEGQKIAIARALLKNASIVILDEPTAALDPRAEHEIFSNFNSVILNRTAVMYKIS